MYRIHRSALFVSVLVLMWVPAVGADEAAPRRDAAVQRHSKEVEAWRRDREDSLRKPDSWLTLVGLTWLREGDNTLGSASDSDVVLPSSAPARVGVIRLAGERMELEATSTELRHDDKPVERLELQPDVTGDPTILELGSISFYVIRRGDQFGVRIKDRKSPAYLGFQGLDYFPISWSWRVEARFERYDPPRTLQVPTILGTVNESVSPGAVIFEREGKEYRLEALESGKNEIWLIFGDETNNKETYGGGRFLYADLESGGRVVVDFNKAYSPPCVFSPYATCPLPPPENRLALAVTAGEKTYGQH